MVGDNEYVMTLRSGTETIMLQKMPDFKPLDRTILGWEVRGIRDVVLSLAQRGAEFIRVEWMEQDELGIWTSPDGKVAWFKDPDGNTLSVAEH